MLRRALNGPSRRRQASSFPPGPHTADDFGLAAAGEVVRGIGSAEYPNLLGYVATTPKPRAETPLWTDKGDPLLAHWQYGLGRAVAFTSDAKPKWGRLWLNWDKYRQFWSQIAQWVLRKVDASDYNADVSIENGSGQINVEALDAEGNFRNFLNLQAVVVDPKGRTQTVRLEQKGPGRYEAAFPAKEVGAYMINLLDLADGAVRCWGRNAYGQLGDGSTTDRFTPVLVTL